MSSEQQNVAILTELYRRWHETRGRSVNDWFAIIDDRIQFGSLPRGAQPAIAFATDYDRKETLRSYFTALTDGWSMNHYTVDEFIAQGDAVVMRGRMAWTNKATGKRFDSPKLDFWRFRDGKAIEFYEYFDTAAATAAAV